MGWDRVGGIEWKQWRALLFQVLVGKGVKGERVSQIRAHLHGYPQTTRVERMMEKRGEEGGARVA